VLSIIETRVLNLLVSVFYHKRKNFAITAASIFGKILNFLKEFGMNDVREKYISYISTELLGLLSSTDKTIKERFSLILNELTLSFPQILRNSKIFLETCNLISRLTKK
jgi:hypothetical protein